MQVQLQMRPEFLRYIGTLEIRVGELEKSLQGKKVERHEAKKRLALIRTNCEKIREIMEKYVSSRASSETKLRKNGTDNKENDNDNQITDSGDKKEIKEREIQNSKKTKTNKVNPGSGTSDETTSVKVPSRTTISTSTDTSHKTRINKDNKTLSTTQDSKRS